MQQKQRNVRLSRYLLETINTNNAQLSTKKDDVTRADTKAYDSETKISSIKYITYGKKFYNSACSPSLPMRLLSLDSPGHEVLCVLMPWRGVFPTPRNPSKAHYNTNATLLVSLRSISKFHAISLNSQTKQTL